VIGLFERLDLGPFQVSETQDGDLTVVEVRGEGALALVDSDRRAGEAVQLLANQAAVRLGDEHSRVVVDIEGDADSRESFLTSLAERVARRALDSGRAVALDPMNGRDRRAIHIAIRDMDEVATMSMGEGRYRQVIVVPEGAPEYEDAIRESGAVENRSG
jgi:spoIIIJ-associated protein